jgi:hypothetical protein
VFVIESVKVFEEDNSEQLIENQENDLMEFTYSDLNPKISLHAIMGSNHPKTTRITVRVGNRRVVILIDSGSTHNFLDSSIAESTQLLLSKETRLRVQIANGEPLLSEGKCSGVRVEVQNFNFTIEVFVIMLASCDMVLGI